MSDINSINYTPLEADEHPFKKVFKRHGKVSIALLIIVILLFIFQITVGFIVLTLLTVYMSGQIRALKNNTWESFAMANGWPINSEISTDTLLPLSLAFGHSQVYSPVVSTMLGSIGADMFAYQTKVGEGRYQRTCSYSVARVILPQALPHIVLRAKAGMLEGIQQDFSDHETLQLEGDFNDYFNLQIEKGQEVDVLEVLSPDIMQTLIGYDQHEDIEIMGNNLYFIIRGDVRNVAGVRQLIGSVVSLGGEILQKAQQAEVVNSSASEQVATTV